jgi:hypothetical protein
VTAAPTAAPIDLVPNGGGPPGTGSWQSGGLMLVGGAWLLAAVFGVLLVTRLRSDRAQLVLVRTMDAPPPGILPGPTKLGYAWLYLLLVLLLAAIASWSSGANDKHPRV